MQSINYSRLAVSQQLATNLKLSNNYLIINNLSKQASFQNSLPTQAKRNLSIFNFKNSIQFQNSQNFKFSTRSTVQNQLFYANSCLNYTTRQQFRTITKNSTQNMATQTCTITKNVQQQTKNLQNQLNGQTNNEDYFMNLEHTFGCHNYHPLPVVLKKGKGVFVWDVNNRKYYDFLSAYSAVNQGHCHDRLIETMIKQCQTLTLTSRAFHNDLLGMFLFLNNYY